VISDSPVRRRVSAGFALLESLIAVGIGAFGLVAISRLQIGLQAESDLAKQVSEATFLGQRRIEELRAYQQITSASSTQVAAGQWGYGNIQSGAQTVSGTNANYNVTWTVTPALDSVPLKTALVDVRWTDRRSVAQVATLSTVISGSDPSAALGLAIPPAGTPIRRPKSRDLNVPVPATDLGNGTSAFTPPGAPADVKLVFSNTSGLLTRRCIGASADPSTWACSNIDGFLVTGYISVDNRANASLSSPIDVSFAITEGALDACYDDSAQTTKTYAGFISYTCVIIGSDHDGVSSTRSRWSGRSTVAGIIIGSGNGNNKVCRYSYDYDANGMISSPEHPDTYAQVTESLENQNFTIIRGSDSCPTGSSVMQNSVQHQP
jgi:Tfp pilus assembly protein PilV